MRRRFFLAVLLGGLACSCSPRRTGPVPAAGGTRYGGTIVLSTESDPKSFNPIIAKETSTTAVTGLIFEGLTETDGITLEVKPALAERWEHDSTGTVWTFHLRKDVVWHDGHPFTADDVVFTFEDLIYNEAIPTSSRDVLMVDGRPIRVRKMDAFTVEFRLPAPFAPFLRLMGQDILPRHVLKPRVDQGLFTSTWGVNEKPEAVVGTGLYRLREYRPGEWIILDRNPNHWKRDEEGNRLPYIQRIIYLVLFDPNMAVLKFKAGEIDAISLRGQDYAVLKPFEEKGNFTIYQVGPSLGSLFLAFNQRDNTPVPAHKRAWFRNRSFRTAVAHAVDKQSMIRNVLGGFGVPEEGPLNASYGSFFNPDTPRCPYDPERARRILGDAGFALRGGVLTDAAGHPVEFTILTNSNSNERIQIASILQDDLRNLGMRVNLLPVEFNTLVTRLTASRDWEAVIIGLTGTIDPHGGRNVWDSSGQLHMWNPGPGNSVTDWEREIDRLFEKGARELDPVQRKKAYDRWQVIACEELPFIYTVSSMVMYGVRNRFENLKPSVYGGIFHNIERIYLKEAVR